MSILNNVNNAIGGSDCEDAGAETAGSALLPVAVPEAQAS